MKYFQWKDNETAILLNHIDWCLTNKQDYWRTIQDKLAQHAGRVPSQQQITRKISYICGKQTPSIHFKYLIDRGTVVLEDGTIADSIVEAMKRGKDDWTLEVAKKRKREVPPEKTGPSQSKQKARKKRQSSDHRHPSHDRISSSRGKSDPVAHHSQLDRGRKRANNVSHDDLSSLRDSSNIRAVLEETTTEPNLLATHTISESEISISRMHERLQTLEEKVKSMSELGRNTERALKMAIDCITWVFREQVGPKNKIPEEIFSTMQLVERAIKRDPSDALVKLIEDLKQANVTRQRYQDIVRELIGPHEYTEKIDFPPLPVPCELAEGWRRIRSSLKNAMVSNDEPVSSTDLAMTGWFSNKHLSDLANGREGGAYEPQPWISTRHVYLDNPTVAQHLLAVVLCQLLFCGTETMCEVTSVSWAFQIYRTVTEDREKIRRIDKTAFQLFTKQSSFINEVLPDRIQKIQKCLEACTKEFTTMIGCEPAFLCVDFMSADAVDHALGLKRTLMLSVFEYEVYFATPGMDFDPVWMDAEDHNGNSLDPLPYSKKKVSICMFPGLVQTPTKKLPADAEISTALLQAKSFFPPAQKASPSLKYDIVVAKAIVLVHDANMNAFQP